MQPPRPTPLSRVVERVASHRDPLRRLLARGSGLVRGRPPVLELYYEPGDPHSHLCAQLLPSLNARIRAPIAVRLVGRSPPADYPERERQRAYALADAARIAPARGFAFPKAARISTETARAGAAAALRESAQGGDPNAFAAREAEVAAELFAGGEPTISPDAAGVDALLRANARRRARLGHYLPAVWQFDGDWFWGVDRFSHLEARLREHDLLDGDAPLSQLHPGGAALSDPGAPLPPLEFFYSFRSPYSYLAVMKMRAFHKRWPAEVRVRPVLPMAMRGFRIPRAKRMYTLRDVRREADLQGIPFGRAADPLGTGARRLLQVFPLARGTAGQLAFLTAAARATWAEGVDVARDDGLRYVCENAGIPWDGARERLADGADIAYAEANRLDLLEAGLWGVPCYRVGAFAAWGQDRFWMLEELLRRAGDGRAQPPREIVPRIQSASLPVASASWSPALDIASPASRKSARKRSE
jgi:2-hydroxychromene-2-carboxylate isomerase